MDVILTKRELSYKKPVLRQIFTREETAEIIVPDALPDVLRIVGAAASPLLRSKDAETGKLTVTGVCDAAILYVPENADTVVRLGTSVQFSASREDPGITDSVLIVADVKSVSAEARMINSRKLVLKLELIYCVEAYETERLTVFDGAEGNEVQLLTGEESVTLPSSVTEKTFSITDSPSVKGERAAEILAAKVSFETGDVRVLGSKLVVKGDAMTSVIYNTQSAAMRSAHFRSPFSQIIDLETDSEPADYELTVAPTGVYVTAGAPSEDGENAISIEIHAVLQCVAYGEERLKFIKDAYSVSYPVKPEYGELRLDSLLKPVNIELMADGEFQTPQQTGSIDALFASAGLPVFQRSDDAAKIMQPVHLDFFCTAGNGEYFGLSRRVETEAGLPTEDGVRLTVRCVNAEDWNAEYNMTPEGVAARVGTAVTVRREKELRESVITALSIDESCRIDPSKRPSLIAYRVGSGDTLWEIAKRFNSAEELIKKANSLEEGELTEDLLLLIPKIVEV